MLNELNEKGRLAKAASYELAKLSSDIKNSALIAIADSLRKNKDYIIGENKKDITAAKESNMREVLIDRLTLNAVRIDSMAEGIEQIAAFARPYR